MTKLNRILLATDLRPASTEAAGVAVQLAATFGSHVTVLHVLEPMPHWPVALHELREHAAEPLREFVGALINQNVDVTESTIVEGPVADTIIRKAKESHADLILIGAGELSRFERFSMGPVAAAIVEHAPQPVLAVRPGGPAASFAKILCPVDQSRTAARGLRNAIRLAKSFGGEVIVLTVVPEVNWLTAATETGQFAHAKAEFAKRWRDDFDKFMADFRSDDVKITTEVREGRPHQQIVEAVNDHKVGMIVMGATGHTGIARVLLGGTTRRVLQSLPCSLLTVKDENVLEGPNGD